MDKKYEDRITGNIVKVKTQDDIWVTLDTGAKIKKSSFGLKYSEVIDPNTFFDSNNVLLPLAEKIKNQEETIKKESLNMTNEITNNETESAIYQDNRTLEEKKQDLLKNYEKKLNVDIESTDQKIDDNNQQQIVNQVPEQLTEVKQVNQVPEQIKQQPIVQQKRTPSYDFFKGFKKNNKITIELKFDEWIADPEFIKLMNNNFEDDILKFYTDEIINDIFKDKNKIVEDIYQQLDKIINKKKIVNKKKTSTVVKKRTRKIPSVPKTERSQIHEGKPEDKPEKEIKKIK
jgi:hypothetical protein